MRCRTSAIALVALACLLPMSLAQSEAFEDCATTTFKIANNRVFVSADVFKYTKLRVGQGTMDCMALCRANDECMAFNFDKAKKWCYLINQGGTGYNFGSRRRMTWSSGYKVCTAHSDDTPWDNTPVDQAALKATGLTMTPTELGLIAFAWSPAQGTTGYNGEKTPTYRVVCGHDDDDWHCDETPLWTSAQTTATSLSASFAGTELANLVSAKCYVETYINDIKVACSKADTDLVGAIPVGPTIAVVGGNTVITFSGNPNFQYKPACGTGGNYLDSSTDNTDAQYGNWVTGSYPNTQTATVLGNGANWHCTLIYRAVGDGGNGVIGPYFS